MTVLKKVVSSPARDTQRKVSRVDAKLMIPGKGDPTKDASLLWENDTIVYAGPRRSIPIEYEDLEALESVEVLMPGMWDCHCHFFGTTQTSLEGLVTVPQATAGARAARDAAAALNAGFTSVRELCGYGLAISTAIDEGYIPGPKIYSSHAILSMTAGHGDLHTHALPLVLDGAAHGAPLAICDGVPECIRAVRLQIRRGAKVIKICATGGVLSLIDDPMHPEFSPEEIRAIVDEAARANLIVAAHCHGKRGTLNALHAGVKTIEHGSFLDDECIRLMLKKDVMLIATRTVVEWALANAGQLNEAQRRKMYEVSDAHKVSYAAAVKAGVSIALGTDIGFSNLNVDHRFGMNGREFKYAVKAGMTPLEAIEAGTASGPLTLGPQAPKAGALRKGYDADFIALAENPLDDITVLEHPEKVTHVWKGGKLFKSPGKPVGLML